MFKNLMMYRVGPAWDATAESMEAGLQASRFAECGASQDKSIGWTEPRGEAHGPLVEQVAGQLMLKLMVEVKVVPGSVITRKLKERVAQIEATTGRKPGKKESRDLKDEIRLDLMPMAFTSLKSRSASSTASRTVRAMRSKTALAPRSDLVLLLALAMSLSCGVKTPARILVPPRSTPI